MKTTVCLLCISLALAAAACSLEDAYFEYRVTVEATGATGCAVLADPAKAVKGKQVTLTVTLAAGMALDRENLLVNDGEVPVSGDGPFQFRMPAKDVVVRAVFTSLGYPISYVLYGGTNHPANPASYTEAGLPLSLAAPGRTGYAFAGWYADAGFIQAVGSITQGSTGARTLHAKWTACEYAVAFDRQDGTGGSAGVTATYDAVMPAADAPTRDGYTFAGYYDAPSGGVQYYTAAMASARNWDKAADTTLHAQWSLLPPPMVAIPAKTAVSIGWAGVAEQVHTVGSISAFSIGKYEVTWALWTNVRTWAVTNGYTIGAGRMGSVDGGAGMTPQHPVTMVNHRDVLAWCNALSERSGLMPVYYTTTAKTVVYRNASDSTSPLVATSTSGANNCVLWIANGYRLPTEAEWEYAARRKSDGSLSDGDKPAGYYGSTLYNGATVLADWGPYAWYSGNSGNKTNPVGGKLANALGLHDMSGNVWEWCWDWHAVYTTSTPYTDADTRGAASGEYRIRRGGSWYFVAGGLRAAGRSVGGVPGDVDGGLGFRLSRTGSF